MRKTTTFRATSCSAAAAVLVLAACGKKGDPLPPLRLVPASAEAVTVRQIGDRVRLTWKAPSRNEDGSSESVDLEKASVLRRVREVPPPPAAPPPEIPETPETTETSMPAPAPEAPEASPSEPPAPTTTTVPTPTPEGTTTQAPEAAPPASETAAPTPPTPAPPPFRSEAIVVQEVDSSGLGELRFFEEPVDAAWIGKRVEYAVVYENRKGRESSLSEVARVDAVSAIAAPPAPTVESGPGFVAVKWSAPDGAPEGVAFSVHRRLEDAKAYPDAPLNQEPLTSLSFEDRTAVFGASLCYVVSAVLGPSGNVSSLPSEEACITPQDQFAPDAPSGLVAVPSEGSVLLSWREVEAADLEGYRVYRGESPEGPFLFLAEVTQATYTDTNAESDETYFYAITAVDNASGTNESARSEAVEVRLNR